MTNSDCHTCYSNLVDCVFEDDCGYRGETSIRNLALWIKRNCENPVTLTCAPCPQPVRTTPCPLLVPSTPAPCPICVDVGCECEICSALPCDTCPEVTECPEPTPTCPTCLTPTEPCPASVIGSTTDCQRLIDQVVEVKNNWVKDFKRCNYSLFEKKSQVEDLSDVSFKLNACLTGYSSCNSSLDAGSFQSLLVNFTWANKTDHLELDLSECQNATEEARAKFEGCVNDAADQAEGCVNNTVRLENLVFSHSEDARFVESNL